MVEKRKIEMKLNKLKSVAHNALRDSIWTPAPVGLEPFSMIRPKKKIVIDLINRKLDPDMQGDDVEKYYMHMADWFEQVLKKEDIPLEVIESAKIIITPEGKTCEIVAQGRTFTASREF